MRNINDTGIRRATLLLCLGPCAAACSNNASDEPDKTEESQPDGDADSTDGDAATTPGDDDATPEDDGNTDSDGEPDPDSDSGEESETDGETGDGSGTDSNGETGEDSGTGSGGETDGGETTDSGTEPDTFSFFVTSMDAILELSGSEDGFGGDLGGLEGADQLCKDTAARVGAGDKTWRAFLSVTDGGDGAPVHAIDRVGDGPWYDYNGRLIANDIAGLLNERPDGDPAAVSDLPDETGTPTSDYGDTHDVLTGTNAQGMLDNTNPESTCHDWTSADPMVGSAEKLIRIGHAWPREGSGTNWMQAHTAPDCGPGINVQSGSQDGVGGKGGYGGVYCFALSSAP